MTYTDSTKRHDFVILFDVKDGNPNGDPDADNMPRQDFQTLHGLVSDVALKRKVRNYVEAYENQPIFIQSQVALNSRIFKSFRDVGVRPPQTPLGDEELNEWFEQNLPDLFSVEEGMLIYGGESTSETEIRNALLSTIEEAPENDSLRKKLREVAKNLAKQKTDIKPAERDSARDRMCRDYYDIRMFGAVLSTGLNAGQVRGPMQMTFARSIDPIFPQNQLLTRNARTTSARMMTGPTEFGRKVIVPYGLYRAHGFFNAKLAEQTGVGDDDLKIFWEALINLFDFDRSAARGEMAMQGIYIFTHDNPRGNAPAHKLFERVVVRRDEAVPLPRAFTDYAVTVDDAAMPDGVTLTRLVG